jgi:mannose-6-phosphate isomerase class I
VAIVIADADRIYKLLPDAVLKPWGLVHREARAITGVSVGVGELWLASAQQGPDNYASRIEGQNANLGEVLAGLSEDKTKLKVFLGANAYGMLEKTAYRGKTEAWYVRKVKGRAGFLGGPKSTRQKEELKKLLLGTGVGEDVENWPKDVAELFGIIEPVQKGEAYVVPAGTLHTMFAIGEDSYLIIDEIQQGYGNSLLPTLSKILMVQNSILSVQVHPDDETVRQAAEGELDIHQDLSANPTVRVYDFGRRPGEYPELGFKLTDVDAGLQRFQPVNVEGNDDAKRTLLAAVPEFVKMLIEIPEGGNALLYPPYGSYHVLHCTKGEAMLKAGNCSCELKAGETAFVPGAVETMVTIHAGAECDLFDDAVPEAGALGNCLKLR